jgi:hypothetical protein
LKELEGIGAANGASDSGLKRRCVHWKIFVWFPYFISTVGICAVFSETAHLFILVVLALLGFEVVVRDVEHFELYFDWK